MPGSVAEESYRAIKLCVALQRSWFATVAVPTPAAWMGAQRGASRGNRISDRPEVQPSRPDQSSRNTRSRRSRRSCASIDSVAIGRASRRFRLIGSPVSSQ